MNFSLKHIVLTIALFSGLLYAVEELPPPRETVLNSAQCCLDSDFTVTLNYPFGKRTSGSVEKDPVDRKTCRCWNQFGGYLPFDLVRSLEKGVGAPRRNAFLNGVVFGYAPIGLG